jgi:hypothetical protein
MTVYRIAKWESVFERAESRKLKQLTWVAMPVGFTGHGYQSLLEEFDTDAPAIYGAWCALVAVAAGCVHRGILCSGRGVPMTPQRIARITGFPDALIARLMEWAAKEEICWLEQVPENELASVVTQSDLNSPKIPASGDHRGNPPTISWNVGGSSGESPDYLTQPNPTRHNPTPPNLTQPSAAAEVVGRLVGDENFRSEVVEVANRIRKAAPRLDRELLWQASWVSLALDRETILDFLERLRTRSIQKPDSYLKKAMRTLCEANAATWEGIKPVVPPAPPQSQPRASPRVTESVGGSVFNRVPV